MRSVLSKIPSFLQSLVTGQRRKTQMALMLVGTEYQSYKICELINTSSKRLKVLYVVNEEPWNNKTFMFGAELRYPSEMFALARKNHIRVFVCSSLEEYERFQVAYGQRIENEGYVIQCVDSSLSLEEIEQRITVCSE